MRINCFAASPNSLAFFKHSMLIIVARVANCGNLMEKCRFVELQTKIDYGKRVEFLLANVQVRDDGFFHIIVGLTATRSQHKSCHGCHFQSTSIVLPRWIGVEVSFRLMVRLQQSEIVLNYTRRQRCQQNLLEKPNCNCRTWNTNRQAFSSVTQ